MSFCERREKEGDFMQEKSEVRGKLTRRGFLKTAGVAAGAVAVGSGAVALGDLAAAPAVADESAAEQTFHTGCRGNCASKCHQKVTVRDGKVVKVAAMEYPEGDEGWRRLCVKGQSQPQRQYDPDRVQYPMKRVEGTERGAGEWERISWDEAIGMVAEKMGAALATGGGTSIGFMSS